MDLSLTEQQVRAVQGGDKNALEELCRRYLPRVRRLVGSRLERTREQFASLDDIVQETFRDAVVGIDRLTQETDGAFCNWIACVVENNVRDAIRRGKAAKRGGGEVRRFADLEQSFLAQSLFEGREPTPSVNARANELEDRIEDAMKRLSERHREVIRLRGFCGMSYREIADAMELSNENTANLLFMRARSKLEQMLGE